MKKTKRAQEESKIKVLRLCSKYVQVEDLVIVIAVV